MGVQFDLGSEVAEMFFSHQVDKIDLGKSRRQILCKDTDLEGVQSQMNNWQYRRNIIFTSANLVNANITVTIIGFLLPKRIGELFLF